MARVLVDRPSARRLSRRRRRFGRASGPQRGEDARGNRAALDGGGKARERAQRESMGRLAPGMAMSNPIRNARRDEHRPPTGDQGGGGAYFGARSAGEITETDGWRQGRR